MKVKIPNLGVVNFPDSMSDDDIKAALSRFNKKKDDSTEKLLNSILKLLKNQQQQIVTKTEVKVVEVPKIVEQVRIEQVEVNSPVSWHFTIQRDEDGITDIIAEPY